MIIKTILKFSSILFALIIFSCEHKLDQEYFKEIEQPSDDPPFELTITPEVDTIRIFNTTTLFFDFDAFGLEVNYGVAIIDGGGRSINQSSNSVTLNPDYFEAGHNTLTAVFETNSGSGSIADVLGSEVYRFEKSWPIIIDSRKPQKAAISPSINEDKNLVISWPKCENFNFKQYRVVKDGMTLETIENASDTSYIDKCYIGGRHNYCIYTDVYTTSSNTEGTLKRLDYEIPILNFEIKQLDSLRIFWNKSKFNVNYQLKDNLDNLIFESSSDTSIVISSPPIDVNTYFGLYINPLFGNCSNVEEKDEQWYQLGTMIIYNAPEFGYNKIDDVVYTNYDYRVRCYDIETKKFLKASRILYYGDPIGYSSAINSTKIATFSDKKIYIFDDKNLSYPIMIDRNYPNNDLYHFILTDNDLIAVSFPNKYILYSVADQQEIASMDVINYPEYVNSKPPRISTSQDGKFVCIGSSSGLNMYSITNNSFTEIYSDSRDYQSVYFNPLNPSQLLLTFNNNKSLEIRNSADFNLIEAIELPANMAIQNIDPKSGNLLISNSSNLIIFDLQTHETLHKANSTDVQHWLLGDVIFTGVGNYVDVPIK